MRHQKQQFVPRSDLSLDHERRGTAWDLSIEDREKAAHGLEVLGYVEDAAILRAMNDRLTRRSTIAAVPDDPRRPLKSKPNRPILVALEGDAEPISDEETFWADVLRLVRRHDATGLSLPARLALDALRRLALPAGA